MQNKCMDPYRMSLVPFRTVLILLSDQISKENAKAKAGGKRQVIFINNYFLTYNEFEEAGWLGD